MAPAVAKPQPHRIVQLTDFHLGRTDEALVRGINTAKSLDLVLAHIASHPPHPDRFLLTGDLAEDPTPSTYDRMAQAFQSQSVPIHFLPGNHDLPKIMHDSLTRAGFQREKIIGLGNWRILLLDSTQDKSPVGNLGPHERQWLSETLESLKACWIILALHHHPIPSGSAWMDTMMIEDSEAFLEITAAHSNIKAILFGHVHQEIDQERENIRFLGTPSTCFQFAPGSMHFAIDDAYAGYRWIELHEDGQLSTQVVRLGPVD
ncbi:MAG: hypothetical protein RLZZ627_1777 [Pseudomonadota bacterium]|jgi:Icc protein